MTTPKDLWSRAFDAGPPERESLARLIDQDGGRDDVENELFELVSDPQFRLEETQRRRFRSQLRRRLRHRESKGRKRPGVD